MLLCPSITSLPTTKNVSEGANILAAFLRIFPDAVRHNSALQPRIPRALPGWAHIVPALSRLLLLEEADACIVIMMAKKVNLD